MEDTIRAFIAIKIPQNVIDVISSIQKSLKSRVSKIRWVSTDNIHLTLKFLGNISIKDQNIIHTALSERISGFSRFSLSAKGIGVFPGLKRPKVLWTGIGGQTDRLIILQKRIDDSIEKSTGGRYSKEKRSFKGHLTLGRIKGKMDSNNLLASIKEYNAFESDMFSVVRIHLVKSQLTAKGSVYTLLNSIILD